MTASTRATSEKETNRFNAHDIDGLCRSSPRTSRSRPLVDEVVAKRYAQRPTADGSKHLPTHTSTFAKCMSSTASPWQERTFTGTHTGVLRSPSGEASPTGRQVRLEYIQVLRRLDGRNATFSLISTGCRCSSSSASCRHPLPPSDGRIPVPPQEHCGRQCHLEETRRSPWPRRPHDRCGTSVGGRPARRIPAGR